MNDFKKDIEQLWMDVLNVPAGTVTPDSQFLDVGGDSLKATQLRARLRERYGVEVPLSELLESVTVADLAALVARSRNEGEQVEEGEL